MVLFRNIGSSIVPWLIRGSNDDVGLEGLSSNVLYIEIERFLEDLKGSSR